MSVFSFFSRKKSRNFHAPRIVGENGRRLEVGREKCLDLDLGEEKM